jgi:hypothetical protein
MSYSTSASSQLAAKSLRRSSRKANANHVFGGVAVAGLVLGCAWTVYANIFAASIYPTLAGGNFDAPVTRHKQSVAAQTPQAIVNNVFAALPEPAPVVAAPATIASTSTLRFDDRFAAAAPQGVAPRPQAETMQLASASPSVEVTKPVDAPKLLEAVKPKQASPAPAQVAALTPAPAETKPAKSTGASVKDMAQRAKAAVMSIASGDRPNMVEKLWGKEPASRSLLSYASADVSATGSLPKLQNPMLGGSPPYDRATAVYDIAARKVYLPDGTVLEAHSGLGAKKDDVRYAHVRMQGVTPPHIYDLKPREALFHGVPALRLTPIGGQDKIFNRDGLLAHTYMLGSGGDSNGCISFKDYYAFLDAYRKGGIRRIAVLARVE